MSTPHPNLPVESRELEIENLRKEFADLERFFQSVAPLKFDRYKFVSAQLQKIEGEPLASESKPTPQKAIEGILLAARRYMSRNEIIDALDNRRHFDGPSKRAEKTSFYGAIKYNTVDSNNFPWVKINGILWVGMPGFPLPAYGPDDETEFSSGS